MKNIHLLGLKVEDKVTGMSGVVTSISYDLYGCVMAIVQPPVSADGNPAEARWFDTKRLTIKDKTPVMILPTFEAPDGPEFKPEFESLPIR